MKNYQGLVFFDLDGTLLNARSQIDTEVIEALKQLHENNIMPLIATGRGPYELKPMIEGTGINSFVSLNGQLVVFDDQTVYKNVLDTGLIEEFTAFAKKRDTPVSYYGSSSFKANYHNPTMIDLYNRLSSSIPPVDPDYYLNNDILMMLSFNTDASMDEEFIQAFDKRLTFYRNMPYCSDVVGYGHSKKFGIEKLVKTLGMENVPTFAFGDGPNDISMFEAVDTPVAMGNAINELKEMAAFVTTKNTENGIINGLKHFNLI